MKQLTLILVLSFIGAISIQAQDDYLVRTGSAPQTSTSAEEQFIEENFPFIKLCDWKEGMKFMVIPSKEDLIFSIFKSYETNKDVQTGDYKHKILEFVGIEEDDAKRSVRFVFTCEGEKLYHEFKNKNLNSICTNEAKAGIKSLAYLGDVDIAKQLLVGKDLHMKTATVKVDAASGDGFKEVRVSKNLKVTITAVGVGSNKAFPVKLVFKDDKDNEYFTEVAFSKTNSGMDYSDFKSVHKEKYFPNVFTFTDAGTQNIQQLESKYANKEAYPIVNLNIVMIQGKGDNTPKTRTELLRYTPIVITGITRETPTSPYYTLTIKDKNNNEYIQEVTFFEDIILDKKFFGSLFTLGNIRKEYPDISAEDWDIIAKGQVRIGMNKEVCRLSLGDPTVVRKRGSENQYEDWIYQKCMLRFEKGKLIKQEK